MLLNSVFVCVCVCVCVSERGFLPSSCAGVVLRMGVCVHAHIVVCMGGCIAVSHYIFVFYWNIGNMQGQES